jgi:2-oxoglutarate dehydrogenase E2 component (dihydrolipoamide succinyltransferase)
MAGEIIVPSLGESVTEATVAKWHKKPGEAVEIDELLVELETDKVTLEVNAPASGKLAEIAAAQGAGVKVGALLGKIEVGAAGQLSAKPAETPTAVPTAGPMASTAASLSGDKILSPAASKLAADNNVDLSGVSGSAKEGRVTKGDVLSAISGAPSSQQSFSAPQVNNSVREERVKMTRLRQTIAARLKESQNTAAILTTFNEIDMSEVMRIRKVYQDSFVEKHGVKLGFMSFFAKAAVTALKDIPAVNAEISGDEILYKNYYDLGVAVGTAQGLVVPVLRNVDQLSFADIEKGIADLGKKAKEGKLTMADMSGGTFSITNGGIYGSMLSTPIINPPQSGILGMHNIVERPVAVAGEVKIRPVMYIALSYDHRIIDGKEAVTFLVKIKQMIENPERLLFDL